MFLEPGLSGMIAVSPTGLGIWISLEPGLPGMIAVLLSASRDRDVSRTGVIKDDSCFACWFGDMDVSRTDVTRDDSCLACWFGGYGCFSN